MKLKLYHYWRSSCSWRVRWALAIKEIPCDFVAIDLLKGENESTDHLKRNPLGLVPVLEFLDGPYQGKFLGESLAIIGWLEQVHPMPELLPQNPFLRAKAWQLAEVINADTQPLQNLNPQYLHSDDPEKRKTWALHWIHNGLQSYEILVKETVEQFSVGSEITVADLCLIPQCYNALRYGVELEKAYPTVFKIYTSALKTEACKLSSPERFKP